MTVGVLRHPLAARISAEEAFRLLHGDDTDVFWLDGGETSYLGSGERWEPHIDVLESLRQELDQAPLPFVALVGWLGYEVLRETVGADAVHFEVDRRSPFPDAAFLRVRRAVAVASDGSAELLAAGDAWNGELDQWRRETETLLLAAASPPAPGAPRISHLPTPTPAPSGGSPRRVLWRQTDEQYLTDVAECQRAIRDGEAYVLNLTTEAIVEADFDPVAVYARLRRSSPSEHGALLRIGGVSLLSSSPEVFLRVGSDGSVSTSPVKGTRGRSDDPAEDARRAAELAGDPKERAENTMIVDLMRNDLARVSIDGTVRVPSMLTVETHAQVHQLASTVEGRLRSGLGVVDVLRASFPAGSMTGAPKRRAIEILDRLEGRPRGLYSGAFGWLGSDGRAELAMTIRSIVIEGARASVGVGGGITALSDPAHELAEVKLKAAAALDALGAY